MGEAKRRRDWVASGGEDRGIVGFRRLPERRIAEGLVNAKWAIRAEARRLARRLLKAKRQADRARLAVKRQERRPISKIVRKLRSPGRNIRKSGRTALRAAGGVVGCSQ